MSATKGVRRRSRAGSGGVGKPAKSSRVSDNVVPLSAVASDSHAFRLVALRMTKASLETARDSARVAKAAEVLKRVAAALRSIDTAIQDAESHLTRYEVLMDGASRLVAVYPPAIGAPPPDAFGGKETEPVDGWCLIEINEGQYQIQVDDSCPIDAVVSDEDALEYVLNMARSTGEQRYIDALRWHVRDATTYWGERR